MTIALVLAVLQNEGQWLVEMDTSNFALGGILSQCQLSEKFYPVAYLSKEMSPSKCNWEICDKELEAIKLAFDIWWQYLLEAREPVQVYSDYKNLTY